MWTTRRVRGIRPGLRRPRHRTGYGYQCRPSHGIRDNSHGWVTITPPREIAAYVHVFDSLAAMAVRGATARNLITSALSALDDGPRA